MGRPARELAVPCRRCIERAARDERHIQPIKLCDSCVANLRLKPPGFQRPQAHINQAGGPRQTPESRCETRELEMTERETALDRRYSKSSPHTRRLLRFCYTIVEAINARDFAHSVFDLAIPTFYADFLGVLAPTYSFDEYISAFSQSVKSNPDHHLRIVEISTDGGEVASDIADVYVMLEVTGRGRHLAIPSLGALRWRKQEGVWRWISHVGMRSFGPPDGYDFTSYTYHGGLAQNDPLPPIDSPQISAP